MQEHTINSYEISSIEGLLSSLGGRVADTLAGAWDTRFATREAAVGFCEELACRDRTDVEYRL